MLCDDCAEHFKFARSDVVQRVLECKRNAVDYAISHRFDIAQVKGLQDELERYQHGISPGDQEVFPCPWKTSEPIGDISPYVESILISRRSWRILQDAATLTECHLCKTLAAMIQYGLGDSIADEDVIVSQWFMHKGSCTLGWLRFDAQENNSTKLVLRFHPVINDAVNSKALNI